MRLTAHENMLNRCEGHARRHNFLSCLSGSHVFGLRPCDPVAFLSCLSGSHAAGGGAAAAGAARGPAPTPATRMDGDVPLGGAIDLVGRCIRRAGLPLRCWSESDGSVADYPPLPLGAGNVVTLGGDSYYGTCVLADTAIRAKDLDESAARKAKDEAERALANRTDAMEVAQAQAQLAQALAQLQALERLRRALKH